MTITEMLLEIKDESNADFQHKLTPTIDRSRFLGIKMPILRNFAKKVKGTSEAEEFLNNLPHKYVDEDILHGLLLDNIKDYDVCVKEVDRLLPYIDNWMSCDILSPKVFKKHHDKLIVEIRRWASSDKFYECRFGMEMLMSHYLDDDFLEEYNEIPAAIHCDEYYVKMMQAWYYATALAKQWDATIKYIEGNRLDKWVHNKTIQKARESFRITPEQKEYLKGLKVK